MKKAILAACAFALLSQPAQAAEHPRWRLAGKIITYPVYILTGYALGHAFGGFFGAIHGFHIWEDTWEEETPKAEDKK